MKPMLPLRQFFLIVFVALLTGVPSTQAQTPGKVDLETAEMIAELIGAPIFARDGARVGEVSDIAFDEDGRPHRLRMVTDAPLGLGVRVLLIPKGAFTTVRGAVVLDVPAEMVAAFAELAEPAEER